MTGERQSKRVRSEPGHDVKHLPPMSSRVIARRASAILVYSLLLISLQIFLMVVAVEGLLGGKPGLARAAAVMSVVLFGSMLAMRWFVGDD